MSKLRTSRAFRVGEHVASRRLTLAPATRRRRGRRVWSWMRRALLAGLLLLVVLAAAGAVYLASLRGVGDAELRTRQIMAVHREPAGVLPVPAKLAAAVVSTEDEHFYDNVIVNVLTGAGRAALAALHTASDPGGSTIGQQLAKELYGHGRGVGGTLSEIGLGVKLALQYSKPQLLAMYLNVNYYGQGYWGVEQAAEGYFHTAPSRLTWPEAAMLAGLLQAPSAYDPVTHYAAAKLRQSEVLHQLVVNKHLTAAQARAAFRAPLPLGR